MTQEYLAATEQAQLVATRQISARELTRHSLDVIARHNASLTAFVHVLAREAMERAMQLDNKLIRTGHPVGPLHGVPVAIKDEFAVRGVPTAMGTNAVTKPAVEDCEAVRRLREAGAVIIGITAMPEFGQWPVTESATHGYTRNPWNQAFSTAGSSGGTAAAVASGMVAAGMGGDGGGSIRLPSAWCGLFGLKAQRGRVSAAPNPTLWRGLGVVGALTRTVADSALMYDVMASHTTIDEYSAEPWAEPLSQSLKRGVGKLRVLLAEKPATGGRYKLEAQTLEALHRVGRALEAAGHYVEVGDLPEYKPGMAMVGQMAAGVSDELKQIDSVKLLEARTRQAVPLYRALSALFAESAERRGRELASNMFSIFNRYDVLLTPTVPHPPVLVGRLEGLGILRSIGVALPMTAYTSIWNVLGNPAAAVPAGFTVGGLPLSVQLVGPPNSEPLLLQLAAQIEQALPWADQHPPLD